MPVGQIIALSILGICFAGAMVYIFYIQPRKSAAKNRPLPRSRKGAEQAEPTLPTSSPIKTPRPRPAAPAVPEKAEGRVIPFPDEKAEAERSAAAAEARRRVEEERLKRAEEEKKRREEEKKRLEEERIRRKEEYDRKKEEEKKQREEERKRRQLAEEARKQAELDARRREEEAIKLKAEEKQRLREERRRRLTEGLTKTRGGFVKKLGTLLKKKDLDDELIEELEEILFTADIGVATAEKLFNRIKDGLSKKQLQDPSQVWKRLKLEAHNILQIKQQPLDFNRHKPFVIMMIGVNGSGKTTTIGKLASNLKDQGKSILLAAGDTFRAAAVEQLQVWAERVGAEVIKGSDKADPSSVIFDAIKAAESRGVDVVIADTAGRLQTKIPLMEELGKIRRVIGKAMEGAPHEVFLVVDSTNGQNAISQAKLFNEALEITGLILTKLDGTAKGGVTLGIADEFKMPIRYIGIGEKLEDLREFVADDFVEALFELD